MDRSHIEDPFVVPSASVKVGSTELRQHAVVTGIVVRIDPVQWAGGPVLEVQLRDETGALCLAFFGRHAIAGVEPGALVSAAGTVGWHRDRPTILNPQLWLREGARPRAGDSVDNAGMRTVDA